MARREKNDLLKVGLTGGIASGKSTVCSLLAHKGAEVIDADQVARMVVEPGKMGWRRLRQLLPEELFEADGRLRRRQLRQMIFADPCLRQQVNDALHPLIFNEIRRRQDQLTMTRLGGVLVVDVPLLFESGAASRFDCTVVVFCEPEEQVERLVRRDGVSRAEALEAVRSQMPLATKAKLADYLIDNTGTPEEVELQVDNLWQELSRLAREKAAPSDTGAPGGG